MPKGTSFYHPTKWFRPFIEEPAEVTDLDDGFKSKSSSLWTIPFLLVLSVLGLVVSIAEAVQYQLHTAFASATIWLVTFLLLAAFRPRTGSLVLVALFLSVFVTHTVSIAKLTTISWSVAIAWDTIGAALAVIATVAVLNMPLRHPSLSRKGISPPFSVPSNKTRSPEDNLTLWQWMSISWMSSLIAIGNGRQLNDEDVWLLGFEFQHTQLHEAFRQVPGTVVWRLVKANWIDLFIMTFLCIFELMSTFASPLLLQQLLRAMENLRFEKRPAIIWALSILALRLLAAQSGVFSVWFGRRCYERSRGEMITMLHEKVLNRKIIGMTSEGVEENRMDANGHVEQSAERSTTEVDGDNDSDAEDQGMLDGKVKTREGLVSKLMAKIRAFLPSTYGKSLPNTKQPASMGKILNLMRNDVYEVSQRFWDYPDIINKPLGLVFSVALAWRLLGWSCLAGIAVVVVAQTINAILARVLLSWEKLRRQATDHKLQQISQYIEAIRHLRWYGWHMTMLENIMSARQKELNLRLITWFFNMVILLVNIFAGGFLPIAVFWAYTVLAGQQLRIDVVFPALQIFSLLKNSIEEIPGLITTLINAAIAVGRIEDFMSEPDVSQNNVTEFGGKLELRRASFSWPGVSEHVLRDIILSFRPGLNLVIGPVASGKSALLQALLGELDLRTGNLIKPDVSMAFCSQTPWLQSMSIRENILFGAPYDEIRYKETLEVCALLPDLASFEHGDLSLIGENGIGLSGGQKARVALARAIYSNAQYLMLDDPLSALDQQTAEWILAKCFRGKLLEDRVTILVTHRIDLCQGASVQTIEMSNGTVIVHDDEATKLSVSLDLQRTESLPDEIRKNQESAAIPPKFEEEEHRAHGGIRYQVYWEYIKAGRLRWWFLVVVTGFGWRIMSYFQNWFLKEWSEAYTSTSKFVFTAMQQFQTEMHIQVSSTPLSRFFDRFPDPNVNVKPWLVALLILTTIQSISFAIQELVMLLVMYTAGKNMFADVMKSISLATFRFYDVTPVGRLMNRITGDLGTVDGPISQLISYVIWHATNWIMAVVIIATVTPSFLILSITLSVVFVYIFLQFLPTSQSLRRLEMVSLSPLMSNFGALLHGLTTVRAFQVQAQFQSRVIAVTDAFQKMDHFYWSLQMWLMFRNDILSASSTFIITMLAIFSGLSPGLTAFVLIAANRFVVATHALCRKYGRLQLDFVSVERVVELLSLEPENPGSIVPPASWPSPHGDIIFENVTIRYAPHLPPALKNVSLTIPGGASAALIGRTGSGKSTLALALLATVTPDSGRILIDGIDTALVSKQMLRSRITFLAQEPVLFPGTLRTNLDPLTQHSDTECAAVLSRIGGDKYGWHLATEIDTGGKNLSQGQRQLVGLARAILRRSSIVILDEATASIDYETSREVQRVLRDELGKGNSTVVGIAHRASAVEGCDIVVQLKNGELLSVGAPDTVGGDQNSDDDDNNGGSNSNGNDGNEAGH